MTLNKLRRKHALFLIGVPRSKDHKEGGDLITNSYVVYACDDEIRCLLSAISMAHLTNSKWETIQGAHLGGCSVDTKVVRLVINHISLLLSSTCCCCIYKRKWLNENHPD